ncbi:MAG: hypothetical protein ABIS29_16150 [Vicinamibacterales bacterium]
MTRQCTKFIGGAAAAVFLSACQMEKSANPLSPAIAGPIEGVVISTPALLEPGQDWELRSRDQPVKLLFQNADSNGARPVKYSFDIATDDAFKNIVFARTGVEPNAAGETQFQLPDKLAAGTYWWRTRAEDGANMSAYSTVKSFKVVAEVVLSPPIPSTPANASTVSNLAPVFKVRGGNRSGVTAPIEYLLQVSNNSAFTSIAATFTQEETWPETTFNRNYSFLYGRTYYWRVRAWHTADGSEVSNFSSTQTFRTPEEPVAPPPAPGSPSPGPSPGVPSNPNSCSSSKGSDIAACIEARYPQYRRPGVSLDQRKKDMQFLRDRLIEHATCKGLQVGQNLKRGGPEISNDFITYFTGGRWVGVDIASGYDDTHQTLNMQWYQHGAATNWGYPYHKPFRPGPCI